MYESHQALLVAVVVIFIYAAAGVFCCAFMVRVRREKEENQFRFFNSVKQGITYGWIRDLDDVKKIYTGIQGERDDLDILIRRFVFYYLVNFRRPLEDQMTTEIKNTIDRILMQLESVGRRDILLGEDRVILDSLKRAIESGKASAVQDKLMDLARLLGDKNQRAVALPVQPNKKYGLVSFGAATAISLVFVLMVAMLYKG